MIDMHRMELRERSSGTWLIEEMLYGDVAKKLRGKSFFDPVPCLSAPRGQRKVVRSSCSSSVSQSVSHSVITMISACEYNGIDDVFDDSPQTRS